MKRQLFAALLAAGVFGHTNASAHDDRFHRGKPVEGEVISVDSDSLRLRTEAGEETITLGVKTKYELGEELVGKETLKPGDRVSILGTKLEEGMVAQEVLIHPEGEGHHGRHGPAGRDNRPSQDGPGKRGGS